MIQGIVNAFTHALGTVFDFVPRLASFLVILAIGWLVSYVVGKAVTMLLRKVGFEHLSERIGLTRLEHRMGMRIDTAGILGRITFWFLFLIFLVPATDSLGLPTISSTLNTLVRYLPNVFVAVLALFLGVWLGTVAHSMIRRAASGGRFGNPRLLGEIARWAIIAFAAMIALDQLRIAPTLIDTLFAASVAGLALAFGLAFGLGGRDTVQRWLARNESQVLGSRPYNPEQIVQQARTDLKHSEYMGQQHAISQPPAESTYTQTAANPNYTENPPLGPTEHQHLPPTSSGYVPGQTMPPSPEAYGEKPPQPKKPLNPRR